MPYAGEDYLKLLDLTGEGQPQKYNDMLKDYHRLYSERFKPGEKARLPVDYRGMSKKEAEARLAEIRRRLVKALGILPHKDTTPPEMHSVGMLKRDGYTVEKVWFEAMPGRPVTGLIYRRVLRPKRAPGILIVHGHSTEGKAAPTTQMRCIELARRGFVVLAVDTAGLGERKPLGHANFAIFAAGVSPQALLVYDNARALDLLCSFPDVDGSKIGLTGSSGGGTQTTYLAALDDRVTASVPTASVCAYEDHSTHSSSYYCQCELVPGMAQFGDIGDFLALAAPRAVLVLMGTRDRTFPPKGARESYLRAQDAFTTLGAPDKIEKFEAYTPHAYSRAMREAMYAFFEKHLMGKRTHSEEHFPVTPEDPAGDEINVVRDGKAGDVKVFPAEDLDALTWRFAREVLDDPKHPANRFRGRSGLAGYRKAFERARPGLMGEPLGAEKYPKVLKHEERRFGDLEADCWVIETECGILVPGLVVSKSGTPACAPLVFYLTREGKDAVFFHRRARELLDAGFRVGGIDVRGTGETCYVYHTEEEYAASNAIVTGRALIDGRARDLVLFIGMLKARGRLKGTVGLWTADPFCVYAALAAYDSPFARRLVYERGLVSLVSESAFADNGIVHLFTPGILKVADVPQLLALAHPRPLLVLNPVDGGGKMLGQDAAEKALSWTVEARGGSMRIATGVDDAAARSIAIRFLKEDAVG